MMGIGFGEHTRNLPIAQRLLDSCKETIKEYEEYIKVGINRNAIL